MNKYYISLAILLVIGIGSYFYSEDLPSGNTYSSTQEIIPVPDNSTISTISSIKNNTLIEKSKREELREALKARHYTESNPYTNYSDEEIDLFVKLEPFMDDIIQWETEKFGYYLTLATPSDYNSYDIESLEAMADQKDMKALDMLSIKYRTDLNMIKSLEASQRAAALGSTSALSQIASHMSPTSLTEKGKHENIMTKLSYLQAALIRGDKSSVRQSVTLLELYKGELNDKDIKTIQNNGRKIIAQLEINRAKINLPAFDNSIPWYVDEYNTWFNHKVVENTNIESTLFSLSDS